MRICIACHELVIAGGLFRFERFGRVAQTLGHEVVFVQLRPVAGPRREIDCEVIDFQEAAAQSWDATMIPGGGFPAETIERFAGFKRPNFGLRVQHILNDQTLKSRFLSVNASFEPNIIVLNNRHWNPASLSELRADSKHVLEGAVDTDRFLPAPARPVNRPFVVGGLSNKNPTPLLDAARRLGDIVLHFFGRPNSAVAEASDLIAKGRIRHWGTLTESQLPGFYQELDCVVHTEKFAGWANLGAEALASGVPLVCTRHGTLAYAEHEVTALVVEPADSSAIVDSIRRLRSDPDLSRRLAQNGRHRIEKFSWEVYTEQLLRILRE